MTLECDDSSDNDFTNTPLLCIEGTKLNDCTDEGIAGWEITLKDDQGDCGRHYDDRCKRRLLVLQLGPGDYKSSKRQKTAGAAVGATSLPVTLECDDSSDNDFTNTPLLCIEGSKLNDCTDEGIAGWEITLKDDQGAVVGTTTTDANGAYSFCESHPATTQSSKRQKTAGRLLERPHSR